MPEAEIAIYFGTKKIHICQVQQQNNQITKQIGLPWERILGVELEEKISDEIKIIAALNEEFRKNNIKGREVYLTLAGENLIIRSFDIPAFLTRQELEPAVILEARKYIPFKIEDLIFDFRLLPDVVLKKYIVLFVAIKRVDLEKYISIFTQMQMQLTNVEYAGFSNLRLLKLAKIAQKGVSCFLDIDFEDESDFIVCENTFPLFSREINLSPKGFLPAAGFGIEPKEIIIERLRKEIRVSLDYFRRKFPKKTIESVLFISLPEYKDDIVNLCKDLGLEDVTCFSEEIKKTFAEHPFSIPLAKSYAVAMSKKMKLPTQFNLFYTYQKQTEPPLSLATLPGIIASRVRLNFKVLLTGMVIVLLSWFLPWYKQLPFQRQLTQLRTSRSQIEVKGVPTSITSSELFQLELGKLKKTRMIEEQIKKDFYITPLLNVIPGVLPDGAWLESLSFKVEAKRRQLLLEGFVLLEDADQEFAAIGIILNGLRDKPEVKKIIKSSRDIDIVLMERRRLPDLDLEATYFLISATLIK